MDQQSPPTQGQQHQLAHVLNHEKLNLLRAAYAGTAMPPRIKTAIDSFVKNRVPDVAGGTNFQKEDVQAVAAGVLVGADVQKRADDQERSQEIAKLQAEHANKLKRAKWKGGAKIALVAAATAVASFSFGSCYGVKKNQLASFDAAEARLVEKNAEQNGVKKYLVVESPPANSTKKIKGVMTPQPSTWSAIEVYDSGGCLYATPEDLKTRQNGIRLDVPKDASTLMQAVPHREAALQKLPNGPTQILYTKPGKSQPIAIAIAPMPQNWTSIAPTLKGVSCQAQLPRKKQ